MKTTLEFPEPLFRKLKATAAMSGKSLKDFVTEAVKEKLTQRTGGGKEEGWKAVFGKLPAKAAREMQAIVTEAGFRPVEVEDWK